MGMRLLIAEDELDLAEALTVFFEKSHFTVDAVHNGFDAYEYAVTGEYDAVILDVMMPKMNGIQVLERLRSEGVKMPIMMLTAKGQKEDRITGFNAGADDYLPKPFDPDELLSRVRAMLRRSEAYRPSVLVCGDLTLDPNSGELRCGTQSVRLSGREFQVMELFLRLAAAGVFRRAHYGKGMGLGQRGGDQRRVGQCLEPAQKAQGHRLGHDAARQPWAGLSAGGGCMIKRLRNRFIRIATLSVAAVMLLLTVLVNTANFASTDSDLTQTLRLIEKNQGTIPLPARFAAPEEQTPPPSADGAAAPEAPDRKSADRGEHDGPFGPETAFSTRYFVLRYTEDGTLLRAELDRIAAVTEDDVDEYLAVAVQRGDCYQAMRMVRTVALWSLAAEAVHHRREP